MKPKTAIFLLFVGFMIIGSFGGMFYYYLEVKDVLEYQASDFLHAIAHSRAIHLETFLEGEEKRVIDFSSDGKIKDCLYSLTNNLDGCTYEELNNHLVINKLPTDENLYDIHILDTNGKIVGTTNPDEEAGEDFSKDLAFLEGKNVPYIKDIFYDEEFDRLGLSVSAPIMREDKFIGVMINKIKPDGLYKILLDRIGLGETGEIYLVNKEGYMISPGRFEETVTLDRKIETENSKECLEDLMDGEERDEEINVRIFEGYKGGKTIGTDEPIYKMN